MIYMNKISKSQLKNIKELLRDKKSRDERALFVIEGEKIINDVVSKGYLPLEVCVSASYSSSLNKKPLLDRIEKESIPLFIAKDADFEKVSSLRSVQGILAVFERKDHTKDFLAQYKHDLIVLADGVQDPGNLGTIIRSAAAFGACSVILTGDSADVYNPKVVRASSGAIFDLPIVKCNIDDIKALKNNGYKLFASKVESADCLPLEKVAQNIIGAIVAFGSEGAGISDKLLKEADQCFYIPINANTESLNVAASVAVTLYAVFRRA